MVEVSHTRSINPNKFIFLGERFITHSNNNYFNVYNLSGEHVSQYYATYIAQLMSVRFAVSKEETISSIHINNQKNLVFVATLGKEYTNIALTSFLRNGL